MYIKLYIKLYQKGIHIYQFILIIFENIICRHISIIYVLSVLFILCCLHRGIAYYISINGDIAVGVFVQC